MLKRSKTFRKEGSQVFGRWREPLRVSLPHPRGILEWNERSNFTFHLAFFGIGSTNTHFSLSYMRCTHHASITNWLLLSSCANDWRILETTSEDWKFKRFSLWNQKTKSGGIGLCARSSHVIKNRRNKEKNNEILSSFCQYGGTKDKVQPLPNDPALVHGMAKHT